MEWLHAVASRDRWWEEHVLLFEELRRVGASFRHEEAKWRTRAEWDGWPDQKASKQLKRGVQAHARKMAALNEDLAQEAERRFAAAGRVHPVVEKRVV